MITSIVLFFGNGKIKEKIQMLLISILFDSTIILSQLF